MANEVSVEELLADPELRREFLKTVDWCEVASFYVAVANKFMMRVYIVVLVISGIVKVVGLLRRV